MQHVYVVFSSTFTNVGKAIRVFTRNKYNHCSFALTKDQPFLYSFARDHLTPPLIGGFIKECPNRFTIKNTVATIKICEVPVTDEVYRNIKSKISYFEQNKDKTIYNHFSFIANAFKKQVNIKDCYTCLEFVSYLLEMPEIREIKQLEDALAHYVIYEGPYNLKGNEDDYLKKTPFFPAIYGSAKVLCQLTARLAKGEKN